MFMHYSEGWFHSHHKSFLFYRFWLPDAPPKALIIIMHGLGEHGGMWTYLVERLVGEDIAVAAPDHRGCGKSGGSRNHMLALSDHSKDQFYLHELLREYCSDAPLFLYGHSFGGLLAFNFLSHYPNLVRGIITSGFGIIEPYPLLTRIFGRILGFLFPRIRAPLSLKPEIMTSDAMERQKYAQDPLIFQKSVSLGFARALLCGVPRIMDFAATVTHPLLFQWGADDPTLAHPERTETHPKLAEVKLIIYAGCRHNPYIERADIVHQACSNFIQWIQVHL